MDVICLDEDDEIQQLQKELADLQKEREKYAKELKKRHLRNEIEKLRNENLQLKTKLIEHASQAHAEKDNDVKPVVEADISIKKQAGSQGSGQDKSIKKPTGSPGSVQDKSIKKLTGSPGSGQDKGIKKLTESPGSGQDKSIKKPTGSPDETGNKRPVGRPRKRPPSPDVAKKGLPEIGIEPGNMSISMNSKRVKLLPCQEDINDCEDNEDNFNTLRENYIWNKNGSPQYLCSLCDFTCEYYTAVYNHLRKEHNKACEAPNPKDKPGDKSKSFESGNLSKRLPTKTRHKLTKHCKIEHRGRKMAFIELGNEHQKNKSHTKEDGDSDIIIMAASAKDTDTGNKDPSDCESDGNNNTDSDDESEEKSDDDKSKSGSFKDKILKTSRGFKCGVCGHQTISYQGLYKHYVTNHKEKKESKFKCNFCRYTTNQRRYCIIHMKKAHTGKPVIYRSVGSVQKAHKTDVTAHASQQLTVTDYISRTAKGFKCTLCGNKTEEYHKTRYHVYYQHFAVFVCPYCEYKSSNRPQVVAHGKKFHPGKPLKITWHVKGKTRQNNLSIKFGDAKEKRKKNNSSDETGNKRPVGRPRKILSSPCVAKKSLPEINREPGYMSISMNSKRVKLLPCQEDIKDKKHHLNKEVSIKANDEVSIKMEPNDLEQSDVRLLPNVYIDKDELYEFVPQVNEPVIDGPLGEQEMPILSSTTFEEDPVPVSSTTVDVTPDEVDGVRDDVTPDEVDGVRDDVTPEKVDEAREDVTPDKVDMAIDVTPDKLDIAREDATPDKVDMARDDVTPDKVDIARENGAEDHPAEKSDREKGNTAETGELDLEMEVESVETEHGKKPSDSKHGNTEKKKDDGEDSDDILSPRMCMHIDQNEVWEIRVDELQAQPGVQSELHQAKIKIENEEEEAAGI